MAWKVSEGEPTCPTSSFFAIQLLARFRLAQRSYAPGWSLEWHLQRTPNQGKIVPPARFALCPSTVNQPESRASAVPWSFKIPPCCLSAHQRPSTKDPTHRYSDDAASAASTTRDITSLLLGSLARGRHAAAALRAAQARFIGILRLLRLPRVT